MNFKHLYEVFRDDLKFKRYERKLISLIQGDWKIGEHDEKNTKKYKDIQRINNDFHY